ncbi:sla2 Src-like adaptor 2, partial [Linderina pennispora]
MNLSHFSLRVGDRAKAEQELLVSIRKATNVDETSPKRKHVRKMIMFSWDFKTSVPVWEGLKAQPLLADEVQCYKALISLHKVIREGHQVCIPEALTQTAFLETLGQRAGNTGGYSGWRNYSVLIRAYVNFLLAKLEYHRLHPEFNGMFDYEEYVSLRGTNDPNEGYETIADLMSLQDRLDEFQKLVFRNFQPGSNNECRIASLVPLVEESYGIYKFATRMLIAMHQRVDGAEEALEPLRTRYNGQHYALRKFYYECSNLRYLTSLITVPRLPQDPPNLFGDDYIPPPLPDRPESARDVSSPVAPSPPPPAEPTIDLEAERQAAEALRLKQEEEERQRQLLLQQQMEQQRLEEQRRFELLQQQQREREQQQLEQLQREQLSRQVQGKMQEFEQQMLMMRGQHERDQLTIDQYNKRVAALEEQIRQLQLLQAQQDQGKDELIRQLQAQIEQWKQKYEALAKLYAQLRQEHLELLTKFKAVNLKANSANEVMAKMDRLQADMKRKNLELADMMRERDKARADLQRMENGQVEELERLRRELEDSEDRVRELSRNKGAEVQQMLAKFNAEKDALQRLLDDKLREADGARKRFDDLRAEHEHLRQTKDDEIAVLQAGMDQSIVAMAKLKNQADGSQGDLQRRLDAVMAEHAQKLRRILDSILRACADTADEAVFSLNDPSNAGNMTATVEHVLATIEQVHDLGNALAASFAGYLANPDGDQTQVISTAVGLANDVEHLLANIKGVSRLASGEDTVERIVKAARQTALVARQFFIKGQSPAMERLLAAERPGVILDTNRELQQSLGTLTALAEGLVPQDASRVS